VQAQSEAGQQMSTEDRNGAIGTQRQAKTDKPTERQAKQNSTLTSGAAAQSRRDVADAVTEAGCAGVADCSDAIGAEARGREHD
jgi:hypothetical protein